MRAAASSVRLTLPTFGYVFRLPKLARGAALDLLSLCADFPGQDHQAWVALVQKVLKGSGPEALTSHTRDGLPREALYTTARPLTDEVRFHRDHTAGDARWDVRTVIAHPHPVTANRQALQDLENGASSLLVHVDPTGREGVAVGDGDDLARVLAGVELELAPVALHAGALGIWAAEQLHGLARSAPRAKLQLHLDPLGAFARTGASSGSVAEHVAAGAELAARLHDVYPGMKAFLASGQVLHEAGGTEAEELALMLSAAVTYLRALHASGLELEAAAEMVVLGMAAEADYFITLVKHRAARALWARVSDVLGVATPARIEARSSRRMLSKLDPWVNLLRLTAAGFGAATGGADALVLEPFTQPLGPPSDFARRQARNIQLVLLEEAGLARVEDPAGGAWCLETLTDSLARTAWSRFQEIEAAGGLQCALEAGQIARWAQAGRTRIEAEIASGETKLVGTSVFRPTDPTPVALDVVDPGVFARASPTVKAPGPDSFCPPLHPWRMAEACEATA